MKTCSDIKQRITEPILCETIQQRKRLKRQDIENLMAKKAERKFTQVFS
jgi:hypothetical protein